jgi:hypothetical protein
MLEYIKIYKIVKTQLEAYALLSEATPDEIKNARAKVSAQYVEFLPDTTYDKDTINTWYNDKTSENDIETAANFFLNSKSTPRPATLTPAPASILVAKPIAI